MDTLSSSRAFLSAILALTCIVGDYLLTTPAIRLWNVRRVVVDNGTHGLVGLLCWTVVIDPMWWPIKNLLKERLLWEILLCGVLSSLLDLDHFAAAKSFKLKDALSLPSRPTCHATTIIPIIGLVLYLFVRLFRLSRLQRLPFIFVVAWLSHHIRDATRRGLWLWPWGSTPPWPAWLYISATVALPFLTIAVLTVCGMTGSSSNLRQSVISRPVLHV